LFPDVLKRAVIVSPCPIKLCVKCRPFGRLGAQHDHRATFFGVVAANKHQGQCRKQQAEFCVIVDHLLLLFTSLASAVYLSALSLINARNSRKASCLSTSQAFIAASISARLCWIISRSRSAQFCSALIQPPNANAAAEKAMAAIQ